MPPLPGGLRRAAARARRRDYGIVPTPDYGYPLVLLEAPEEREYWSHSHRLVASLG
ncbi:hypothetical protein [Streptomyces sp. MA5143a]|uniref:hypothetical protein n=1 Tax=Streptomyces sp. MA5143a TaxID=2083010 RepID=UPI000D2A34C3|nr:hypothetical protein [Streptomyces sp. MA5143a]SPF06176.1 hypothetical protein SMA5143A_6998 [Streptomyces sp. MA5143a]